MYGRMFECILEVQKEPQPRPRVFVPGHGGTTTAFLSHNGAVSAREAGRGRGGMKPNWPDRLC